MKKEAFKSFIKDNPQLVNYVINKKMTWQQFYEIYDLYGENDSIWNNFKESDNDNSLNSFISTFKDIRNILKGIDLKSIQKVLSSLDKAIEAFKGKDDDISSYDERPKYKYFED